MSQADDIYGPNTAAVKRLIHRAHRMTEDEKRVLSDTWRANRGQPRFAAWYAVMGADMEASRGPTRHHTWWDALNAAKSIGNPGGWWPERAIGEAAVAVANMDLIPAETFELLVAPVVAAIGRAWE